MGDSNFCFFGGGGDLFLMGLRGRFIENFPNVAEGWGLSNICKGKNLISP